MTVYKERIMEDKNMGCLLEVLNLYSKNKFEDAEKMIIPIYLSFPKDVQTLLLY